MSRDRVLASIRKNLAQSKGREIQSETPSRESILYERVGVLSAEDRLELLAERLREYDAGVFLTHPGHLTLCIAEILAQRGKRRMAVPAGVPAEWMPEGFDWVPDCAVDAAGSGLSTDALNAVDGVLTGASLAVAASGSVVLQHGAAEGRRVLTLLPDYHLCVLREEQVTETLPEAFERLAEGDSKLVTFFSGPSATADIEMTRIKGVHGPRFLDVVIVRSSA